MVYIILTVISAILLIASAFSFWATYKVWSVYRVLNRGYDFVRIKTGSGVLWGWVRRNEILGLERMDSDRARWFIDVKRVTSFSVAYSDIAEIKRVNNPFSLVLHSPRGSKIDL